MNGVADWLWFAFVMSVTLLALGLLTERLEIMYRRFWPVKCRLCRRHPARNGDVLCHECTSLLRGSWGGNG